MADVLVVERMTDDVIVGNGLSDLFVAIHAHDK